MNFKVSKKNFYNALSIASRGISSFSPLPAYSGIKIDANDNTLKLTGSDSDISIQTILTSNDEDYELVINENGSIVLEAKYILEIVRKIDSEIIEVSIVDGQLTRISGHTAEFKINGIKPSEYPAIDFSKPDTNFKLSSNDLKNIINQTVFATSDKETRPVLTGVNFSCDSNKLCCVATDSYRLAKKNFNLVDNHSFNITVPAKSLNEVSKVLENENNVEVAISNKKIQFIFKNTIIQTRLIDGVYPETNRLIPSNYEYELTIDKIDILNAIDRASFIKTDGISVIKLSLSENECILSNKANDVGSSTEVLSSASFKGKDLDISFNGKYAFDAIKALSGSLVRFKFCGEMKPFVVEAVDDDSILQLVLPVRTYA